MTATISPIKTKARAKPNELDLTVADRELFAVLASNRGWQIRLAGITTLGISKDRWVLTLSFSETGDELLSINAVQGNDKPFELTTKLHGSRCFRTAVIILGGFV